MAKLKYTYDDELENDDNIANALIGIANELVLLNTHLSDIPESIDRLCEDVNALRADIGCGFDRIEHALRS